MVLAPGPPLAGKRKQAHRPQSPRQPAHLPPRAILQGVIWGQRWVRVPPQDSPADSDSNTPEK